MAKSSGQTTAPSIAPPAPTIDVAPQVMTVPSLLSFLWDNFPPESLSDGDLEFLSCASEEASTMSRWLARHVNGVACLVDTDRAPSTVHKSGALQEEDQPLLLNLIASQIETIGELARIGGEASFMQRNRLINRGRHE